MDRQTRWVKLGSENQSNIWPAATLFWSQHIQKNGVMFGTFKIASTKISIRWLLLSHLLNTRRAQLAPLETEKDSLLGVLKGDVQSWTWIYKSKRKRFVKTTFVSNVIDKSLGQVEKFILLTTFLSTKSTTLSALWEAMETTSAGTRTPKPDTRVLRTVPLCQWQPVVSQGMPQFLHLHVAKIGAKELSLQRPDKMRSKFTWEELKRKMYINPRSDNQLIQ